MLAEAMAREEFGHGWLFTGPVGVGKATTARAVAAALVCPAGGDGSCSVCMRVQHQVHPDVTHLEPDGERLLVEDVRSLRDEAWRSRHEAPVGVFIIDEADRLTDAAANALLKLLEEPPGTAVFILIAAAMHAVPATVRSRLRTLSFGSIAPGALAAALVAEFSITPQQAIWAVEVARGRPGRARSLVSDVAAAPRRALALQALDGVIEGGPAAALDAAATVLGLGDAALRALEQSHVIERANLEAIYGTGRAGSSLRRQLETTHRRALRRARLDLIRETVADLASAVRDVLVCQVGACPALLIDSQRRQRSEHLAQRLPHRAAMGALGHLLEADRALAAGATPLLALERALLEVQAQCR